MKLEKSGKNLRRTSRRTVIVASLVLVLLLALAGVSFAAPSAPLGKSTLGDYVWHDTNADGIQDAGETGIDGVIVNLYQWIDANNNGIQDSGEVTYVGSMTTGDDPNNTGTQHGWYDFDVTADGNVYIVEIAPSNFASGGALNGYVLTGWPTYGPSPTVVDMPDLIMDISDVDYGYARTSLTVTKNPPTQTLLPGSTATFQVIVQNTGEVYIKNIDLTENLAGATCTPDPIPGPLAPGATATATCTYLNVQTGLINTVSATATPSTSGGTPLTGSTPSGTSGPAEVLLAEPAIDVEKYVSIDCKASNDPTKVWVDADSVTGPYLNGGTCAPQFKIVVTNTGNVALSNVDVTDSVYGNINLNGTLAVGASATYYVTGTWAQDQHTNVATASGDYSDGQQTITRTDTDAANYFGSNPEIDVEKYVSIDCKASNDPTKVWVDADSVTGPYLNGGTCAPQFKIVVTNTGNVALSNVDVTDSVYGNINLNGTLAVGASATYYVTGTWAQDQHTNVATASGDYVDGNGNTETDSDTDAANYFGSNPEIDVEKYVSIDCKASNDPTKVWVDADSVTGPYLNGGTCAPQFKIVVTNTGNVALSNVDVTDSVYGNINLNGTLAVGASATYYVTGTWAQGQHTNVATASGEYTDGNGNTETDSDTDAANYFGSNPEIDVEKYVSIDCKAWDDPTKVWVDADSVTGPYLNGATCAPQFKIVVTNTGNVPLSNVDVTDSVYGNINLDGTLAVGASATYYVTGTWAQGQHTNVATASGDYVDGNGNTETDTDTDAANYYGSDPEIDVEKYVSIDCKAWDDPTKVWVDADSVTGPYLNGATCAPQFKIVVTNTGNVALSNVDVTDSVYGNINLNGTLAVGASATYYVTGTWAQDQHTNVATASGEYTDGNGNTETDTDTDAANYYGSDPEIDVEKYVSIDCKAWDDPTKVWVDADSVTGPYLNGATCAPQFKIVVTNTGNVALSNVDVTDSVYGNINLNGTLAVGASATYYVTGTWAQGQHTNVATASGEYTDGNGNTETDTDTDAANYYGANPSIDVEKYVSIDGGATWQDADAAPGPTLVVGTNPQFRFTVTNNGNVTLTNITLTDNTYSLAGCTVPASLAAGASFSCTITVPWAAGQHTNTASTSGQFTDGNGSTQTKTDTDDANYLGSASKIGDYVWWDVNGNGVQDAGEPAIPGVDVTLFGYPTDTTDGGGIYTFENLPQGSYVPTIPASEFAAGGTLYGFTPTTPFLGGNVATDSNGVPDGLGGVQASVNLPANTTNTTIDFGFVKPTSYTLTKTAVTVGPVATGDSVQFKITIQNTGQTYISVLPLVDTFDPTYLSFVSASVAPDLTTPTGTLTWTDLTGAGMLAPGSFFDVYVNFIGIADTTMLANSKTVNSATVLQQNTRVDPDGPGGISEAVPPVPDRTSQDGIQVIQPTGVTLATGTVTIGPDGALIAWETADESAILGFNVLRDGVAVNAEFILASVSGVNAGAAYSYLDAAATGASVYALEVVGLDGSVQRIELGN